MTSFTVLILAVILTFTSADNSDMCDKINLISNFDAKQVEGIWYGQKASGTKAKTLGDCLKFNIKQHGEFIRKSARLNGEYKYTNLTLIEDKNTSKYYFTSTTNKSSPNYWVDTDYITYAIYYHCSIGKGTVVISTREKDADNGTMAKAIEAMKKNGFNTDEGVMTTIKQNGCINY